MEQDVVEAAERIRRYPGSGDSATEDALFEVHTAAALTALASAEHLMRPVLIWERVLRPAVVEAEARLGRPIHKGAPCYNTALCAFLMHDFDGAYQYLMDAYEEDLRLGGTGAFGLLIGRHALSQQFLIGPLLGNMGPRWASDYKHATGCDLDADELTSLLEWLAQRPTDAFVTISELHRIWRVADRVPSNQASRFVAFRSLADLLVNLESAIRRVQGAAGSGQLFQRLSAILAADARVRSTFDRLCAFNPGRGESAIAVNNGIAEAIRVLGSATNESERAGCVCYACYRLRNSLLHLNEQALDVYRNLDLGVRMAGLILAAYRIVRHCEESSVHRLT